MKENANQNYKLTNECFTMKLRKTNKTKIHKLKNEPILMDINERYE